MPTLQFVCDLNAPLERVWAFHEPIETLFRLSPPGTSVRLDGLPEPMRPGVIYRLRIRRFGLPLRWDAQITEYQPPHKFVDVQVPKRGPFRTWQHRHLFVALSGDRTRLTDEVTYTLPFGPLGVLADVLFVRRDLIRLFQHRHQVTREAVEAPSHALVTPAEGRAKEGRLGS